LDGKTFDADPGAVRKLECIVFQRQAWFALPVNDADIGTHSLDHNGKVYLPMQILESVVSPVGAPGEVDGVARLGCLQYLHDAGMIHFGFHLGHAPGVQYQQYCQTHAYYPSGFLFHYCIFNILLGNSWSYQFTIVHNILCYLPQQDLLG